MLRWPYSLKKKEKKAVTERRNFLREHWVFPFSVKDLDAHNIQRILLNYLLLMLSWRDITPVTSKTNFKLLYLIKAFKTIKMGSLQYIRTKKFPTAPLWVSAWYFLKKIKLSHLKLPMYNSNRNEKMAWCRV